MTACSIPNCPHCSPWEQIEAGFEPRIERRVES